MPYMFHSSESLSNLINPIAVLILQRWNTELHESNIMPHTDLVSPGWTAPRLLEHDRTQLNFFRWWYNANSGCQAS